MIDLGNLPDPAGLDTDALLGMLGDVASDLEVTVAREEALYEYRTRLLLAGRQRDPRVTLARLADAGRMSEAACTQVLHKQRRLAAGE